MRTIESEIEAKVDELLVCLEADVKQIQENLSYLNEMRGFVIKRDDEALGKLLENIKAKANRYDGNELKRQSKRRELANLLGRKIEKVTLSELALLLPHDSRERVIEMQTKLRALTDELKKEHMSTSMLLSECARFNNLLLRTVFDLGQSGSVYYNSNGAAKRHMDAALMNMEL